MCFYCGRLGHGTNDSKEVFGDHSSIKMYGPWMEASPWKPMKTEEDNEEMGSQGKCGRRLYFSKKLPIQEYSEEPNNNINNVMSLLNKVVIGDGEEDDHGTTLSPRQVRGAQKSKLLDGIGDKEVREDEKSWEESGEHIENGVLLQQEKRLEDGGQYYG